MAGYKDGGVDFDTLFKARTSTKVNDVGYKVSGTDISNTYEPIGSGTPISNTGYTTNEASWTGQDLAAIFMDINEVLIGGDWPEAAKSIGDTNPTGTATVRFTASTDGTYLFDALNDPDVSGDYLDSTGVGAGTGFWVKWVDDLADDPPTDNSSGWTRDTYLELTADRWVEYSQVGAGTLTNTGFKIYFAYDNIGTGEVEWNGGSGGTILVTIA